MGWRRLLVGLLGAVVVTACGGNGGQAGKVSLAPSPGPSATPCQTAECRRTNYHRQDLTFSGALNGHVDRARVATCLQDRGSGYTLALDELRIGQTDAGLNLAIGADYRGAGKYVYLHDSLYGAVGVVSTGFINGVAIRYVMSHGSITVAADTWSGSVDADFSLQADQSRVVHLTGTWSCVSPRP